MPLGTCRVTEGSDMTGGSRGWRARPDNVLLAVLFLILLSLPVASTVLGWDTAGLEEKRLLAPPPALKLEWKALKDFPGQFEAYFNDHFGFRDRLIRWHNYAKVRWLRVSPSPKVFVGRRGWLYYAAEHGLDDKHLGRRRH